MISGASWVLHDCAGKILSHNIAYNWIKLVVGNGANTYFWTDNWSPFGRLDTVFAEDPSFRRTIYSNATLRELYSNGNWTFSSARSEMQVSLQAYITTLSLTTEQDTYVWAPDNKLSKNYNTGQNYALLRDTHSIVPWAKVVWNSGGIPKHSFMVWLVNLDRIPTRARLLNWGIQVDPSCLLCQLANEDRNHLFFDCNFSWTIWDTVAGRCRLPHARSWTATIEYLQQLRGNKNHRRVIILAWQSTIYLIWEERNSRLHRGSFRSADAVISAVDRTIRNRISGFRKENPSKSLEMMQFWLASSSAINGV